MINDNSTTPIDDSVSTPQPETTSTPQPDNGTTAEENELSDREAILGAIKELTTQVVALTKTLNAMKETHDKWVRAGKF